MERVSFTKPTTWSVQDLVAACDKDNPNPPNKERVEVPKYQRGIVWDKDKKKAFIESLKHDFPVGSLLLHKVGTDHNGITKYSLIDGLQRTVTINEYVRQPTRFFDETNVELVFITDTLASLLLPDTEEMQSKLIKVLVSWTRELKGFEEEQGFSAAYLADRIDDSLGLNLEKEASRRLRDTLVPYTKRIKQESNILNVNIPLIIYTGPEGNLPLIFQRINSSGTKLSRYEIYAATWSLPNSEIKIDNREIINLIKAKYDSLINKGLEVSNYSDISEDAFYTGSFTVFEYVFGLGKLFSVRYPELFGASDSDKDEDGDTESIAFNLLTICLGKGLKDMDDLPQLLKDFLQNQGKFEEALLDSISFIYRELKPFIGLRANSKKRGNTQTAPIVYHSEYQIVSLISTVYRQKYNKNLEINPDWRDVEKQLRQHIPQHYLYDIIRQNWRRGVKEFDEARYNEPIHRDRWDVALDEWFESQLTREEKARVKIRPVDILFLKYIYAHLLTSYQENSTYEFEIDHLVPVARLKKIISDKDSGLPISSVANLCLTDKPLNRDKSDRTIYEYLEAQVNHGEMLEAQAKSEIKNIEALTMTEKADLEFVSSLSAKGYRDFLTLRFQRLKEEFYLLNEIPEKPVAETEIPSLQ